MKLELAIWDVRIGLVDAMLSRPSFDSQACSEVVGVEGREL